MRFVSLLKNSRTLHVQRKKLHRVVYHKKKNRRLVIYPAGQIVKFRKKDNDKKARLVYLVLSKAC